MSNVQSAVTCESERVPSSKAVYFGISKLVLYFPYNFHAPCILLFTVYFHVPCTVHFSVYFHTVMSMFVFICYAVKRFHFVFIKDLTSVSHSNERAVTAENA